jgi:glycosyltransferase involved in cell wall biosynthesis
MRLLFLTGQLPYPSHAGGALRTFGLLGGLHQAGHTLDLLTFCEASQPDPLTTPLAALCRTITALPAPHRPVTARLRDLLTTARADMEGRYYSPVFDDALKRQLQTTPYDVIQIESLEMATYLGTIKRYGGAARIIYDSFNAEYELQRTMFLTDRSNPARLPGTLYSLIQWRRLRRFERWVCQGVDHVVAVSDADADAFRALLPGVRVSVVPNGIHVREYSRPARPEQLDLGPSSLLFTGTMNYRPNIDAMLWFTGEVMGTIREMVPTARLFVVGKAPHARLDALRQRPDVEITGFVQDVRPFLYSASVYVAPLRMGSGTRLKLLQAMAAGCAVVSTRVGALGLRVQPGEHLVVADDAAAFAQAVVALLGDPARRAHLGAAAHRLVASDYDWAALIPTLLTVYASLESPK